VSSNIQWVIREPDLVIDGQISFGFGVPVSPADVGVNGVVLLAVAAVVRAR
jgi:hypothetical protein